jgi:hypothetical protein
VCTSPALGVCLTAALSCCGWCDHDDTRLCVSSVVLTVLFGRNEPASFCRSCSICLHDLWCACPLRAVSSHSSLTRHQHRSHHVMYHAAPCCVHEGTLPAAVLSVSFSGGLAAPTLLFIVHDLVASRAVLPAVVAARLHHLLCGAAAPTRYIESPVRSVMARNMHRLTCALASGVGWRGVGAQLWTKSFRCSQVSGTATPACCTDCECTREIMCFQVLTLSASLSKLCACCH